MPRNLDHRIEVICPVLSTSNKQEIKDIINIQLRDNVKSRELQGNKINSYRKNEFSEKHRSQFEIYEYLKSKIK